MGQAEAWSRSWARRPNPVYSPEYQALVRVISETRRERGLSQGALALRLGKAKSHVAMIERGQRRVDSLELVKIACALGMKPEDLFVRILSALSEAGLSLRPLMAVEGVS